MFCPRPIQEDQRSQQGGELPEALRPRPAPTVSKQGRCSRVSISNNIERFCSSKAITYVQGSGLTVTGGRGKGSGRTGSKGEDGGGELHVNCCLLLIVRSMEIETPLFTRESAVTKGCLRTSSTWNIFVRRRSKSPNRILFVS